MRGKVEEVRAESEKRGKAERTRVSTKIKANTEALDISKSRDEVKAKEITQMEKSAIKANSKVYY